MDTLLVTGILIGMLAFSALGMVLYMTFGARKKDAFRTLMARDGEDSQISQRLTQSDFELIKEQTKQAASKKQALTVEEKLFRAGILDVKLKNSFHRLRFFAPLAGAILGTIAGFLYGTGMFPLVSLVLGVLIGLQIPVSILERRTESRYEEIIFYLPLVIEQIAIGVSSSLDVGPCIARVVQMADERDSHNVVTELLRMVQFQVKSGVSLEEALTEIGVRTGQTELKHAFLALAQVAKHGGEITRQLNELADAVANQRAMQIEAKIKKLELAATGPVALVFLGFLAILLIGFGIQIRDGFG